MQLKQQAKAGMIWTFAQQFGSQIINFIVSVVLARLLLPEDFGTIALFGIVMGICTSIIDGGMGSSLIRTQSPDEKDYSTVFIFNFIFSLLLYGIVYLSSPLIAVFFEVPELTKIIRVYAIILIINAISIVQKTRLTKDMNFKTQFIIKLPSLIISGFLGVFLAYKGFGVWALVYLAIAQSLISSLQFWFYGKWIPQWVFDYKKFKYHFSFGYRMTLAGLLNIVFINVYTVIIGKLYSPVLLGYYNRADSLKQLPVNNISSALNKVTFPLFAKISHDDVKLRDVYERIMRVVMFIIAPILIAMMVLAEPLIRFLITDKWLPAVPYFQILAIAGLLFPVQVYNLNVLSVKGRSDLFLRLEIIKKIFIAIVVAIAIPFGIYGLLWGQVIISVFAFFVNSYFTGRFINYNAWQQMRDLLPSILLAAFCGVLMFSLTTMVSTSFSDLLILIGVAGAFACLYIGMAYLLKFKELIFIKQLIKK